MKVLYLVSGIGPPAGWGTEFIQELIFRLSKEGIQATIINPIYKHTHPKWRKWTIEQEKRYGVKIIPLEFPDLINRSLILNFILTPFFVSFATFRLLSKEKFDFVHEFSSTPIILLRAFLLEFFFKTPTIFTLSVYNNTLLGKFFWFKLFNFAKAYCIPSKEIIDNLKSMSVNSNKIFFTPPGIEINKFNRNLNKSIARTKLKLPKKKIILSFFGSLTEEKGISDLVDAVQKIDEHFKNKLLVAVFAVWKGSTNHKNWVRRINELSPYLKVSEKSVHIPTVIAASDMVILPQRTGHGATIPPISVLEVLSSKTPLIATDIIGNRELVKIPDILLPPKNPDALCKAMEEILKDKPRIHQRGINLEPYNIKNVPGAYLKIYRSMIH